MTKPASLLILLLMAFMTPQAQDNRTQLNDLAEKVRLFYNNSQPDSIYALTGSDFRKEISPASFTNISKMLKQQLGKWNSNELLKHQNGVSTFKAAFDNLPMDFFLSLDSLEKIKTFLFRKHESDTARKTGTIATSNPRRSPLDKEVDQLIQPYISKKKTVGLCMAVIKGDSVFTYSYGETAKGNRQLPTTETLFEIGSISKTFTSTLLAYAITRQKMKPGDPVSQYLPDSIPALNYKGQPITLLSLTNHSSGLPRLPFDLFIGKEMDAFNPYKHYSTNKLFAYLRAFKPYREPGKQFEYSNLGVGLLATVLERNYKMPYETLVAQMISRPLGMSSTKIQLSAADKLRFALGHNEQGEPTSSWEFQSLAGAGAIRSSVSDMVRYLRAQMGQVFAPELSKAIALTHAKTFENPAGQDLGMAWFLEKYAGGKFYFHGGQTGGYVAFAGFDKERKNGVVILTNASMSVDKIGVQILSALAK